MRSKGKSKKKKDAEDKHTKPSLRKLERALKEAEEKGFCSWCGGIEHTGPCEL